MAKTEDLILPLGMTAGGYFILKDLLGTGKDDELRYYKSVYQSALAAIENEEKNKGELSDSELRSHIAEFKSKSKAVNRGIDRGGRQNLDQFESRISDLSLGQKSMQWKMKAAELAIIAYRDTASEGQLERMMEDVAELIPHAKAIRNLIGLYGAYRVAKWLFQRGDGGGGIPDTIGGWIDEGLIPDYKRYVGYDGDPEPEEEPEATSDPEPSVSASPRALPLPEELMAELAMYASVPVANTITLGQTSLNAIAGVTDTSVNWLVNNPGKAVAIGLALVAAAALVISDGPLPIGDTVAYGLLRSVGSATGVSLPSVAVAANVASKIAI